MMFERVVDVEPGVTFRCELTIEYTVISKRLCATAYT